MLLCQLKAISEHSSRTASPRRHFANSSRVKEMGLNQSGEGIEIETDRVSRSGEEKWNRHHFFNSVRLPKVGKY